MTPFKKKKPDVCPNCGSRLFMENADGSRTCSKCGTVIGAKEGGVKRYSAETPKPLAKQATCPSCGSKGDLVHADESGLEHYRCSFCGESFQIEPKKEAPKEEGPKALDGKAIFDIAKRNTVEIHAIYGEMGAAGSGFFFGDGMILTNCHVVTDDGEVANKVKVNFKGDKEYEAKVVYMEPEQDMALLVTKLSCDDVVTLADDAPETGETIFAVGNTNGEGMCILEGLVADKERQVMGLPFMMVSANTFHGNSGGPIFNNKGEVVGILTLGNVEVVAMNYAIPLERVRAFLKRAFEKLDE